jgi:hypothetical protein
MTDYGLTATGVRRKTFAEMLTDTEAFMRERIAPNLVLDETTPEGNINRIVLDQLDQCWELAEAAAGALDPDNAEDFLLVGLCKLTGIARLAADYGHVAVTLTFDQATTIAADTLLLAVDGEATNLWSNDDDIVVTGAGSDSYNFTSTTASSDATALAGTLTVIATPKTGLTGATNPLDATPGTDIESLSALRLRREASLAGTGKATVAAIRAALIGDGTDTDPGVDGVVDIRVIENDTDAAVDGIPPRAIRVVVWDGTGTDADDDELAQAIYDAKAAGTITYGLETGDAEDPWGDTKPQLFDRAEQLEAYIDVEVTGTASSDDIKTALIAAHDVTIANDLLYAALVAAAFGVSGVTNVLSLTLGLSASPTGTADIPAGVDQVIVLDSSRIGVTLS